MRVNLRESVTLFQLPQTFQEAVENGVVSGRGGNGSRAPAKTHRSPALRILQKSLDVKGTL